MARDEWDERDIARASEALDDELDKIFRETRGVLGGDFGLDDDDLPDAEILPDELEDDEPPEADIIDDEDDLTMPGPISREELAAIIEKSVERGIVAALKKLGKI